MTTGRMRFTLSIGCLAAAAVCPMLALTTTNDVGRPPVLTMPGSGPEMGLFPAAWTITVPGLATAVGVLLPLVFVGVATYVLVRRPCSDQGDQDSQHAPS